MNPEEKIESKKTKSTKWRDKFWENYALRPDALPVEEVDWEFFPKKKKENK